MERQLAENVATLLTDRGVDGTVERREGCQLIRTGDADAAADTAADAPGVVSTSPSVSVDPERGAIEDTHARVASAEYRATATESEATGTFAVRARRSTHELPFTSDDIEEFGGSAVWTALEDRGGDPAVDLENPDRVYHVEARREEAFVFTEKREGVGGLPLGSQETLVALVSGGIDSPVAAFEAMKRGPPVVPVYLDSGDYGGPDHRARTMETVRRLSEYAPNFHTRVRVVPAGETVGLLAEPMERGRMLTMRRYVFRVAEQVAERTDAAGIVTGEAIGQKSSRTARNLRVTSAATDLPIYRPLLSMVKTEISERARAIGTFDDSTIPVGCNRFAPDRPKTNDRLIRLREVEPDDLLERAAEDAAAVEVFDPTE